ncbi:hypothetical protein [Streptomyces sp. NPDC057579]
MHGEAGVLVRAGGTVRVRVIEAGATSVQQKGCNPGKRTSASIHHVTSK